MSNSRELLSISVNITKTKQHITNLQNQISAQQATYLKSQNMGSGSTGGGLSGVSGGPPGSHLGGGSGGSGAAEPSMPDLFNELTLSGSANSGMSDNGGGSRLSQWKLNDNLFTNKVLKGFPFVSGHFSEFQHFAHLLLICFVKSQRSFLDFHDVTIFFPGWHRRQRLH